MSVFLALNVLGAVVLVAPIVSEDNSDSDHPCAGQPEGCADAYNDYLLEQGPELAPEGESDDVRQRYEDGFQEACQAVWNKSPDGDLYAEGPRFTVDDCLVGLDVSEAETALDGAQAYDLGWADGIDSAFRSEGFLCWGSDCYTSADF